MIKNFICFGLIFMNTLVYANESPIFLKKDILKNQKNENLTILQEGWNLPVTGMLDENLQEKIKEKQQSLGLVVTGIIDPITWLNIIELPDDWKIQVQNEYQKNWNTVIEEQYNTYKLNNSTKFIVINIPSMTLKAFETNSLNLTYDDFGKNTYQVLESKVIVGKPYSKTPLKNINITGLKYNPNWTPTPNMIKVNGKNPNWVKKNGFIIYDNNGNKISREQYFNNIELGDSALKYRFVQPSSDRNALGTLKFETDSNQNIYLHDTNAKNLFETNNRIYSAGCVRVERYLNLASFINNNSLENIQNNIDKKKMYIERTENIPVYFTYNLMDIKLNGQILYFPDIYQKD